MAGPEKQDDFKEKPDSFFGGISDALRNLKNKLLIKKSPEKEESTISKEQQESGKNSVDLNELKKEILTASQKREGKSELLGLHEQIVANNKAPRIKNTSSPYIPTHPDSLNRLEKNQDTRVAAPWIVQSADELRNDIQGSPLLNYFFA